MNWYIALGIKIFASIILLFQMLVFMDIFVERFHSWVNEVPSKWNVIIEIITILSFSITIPIACWIYNL